LFVPFHHHYLEIVDEIERNFPVADWKSGDVGIWPLARIDLHLDMQRQETGELAPRPRTLPLRALGCAARPAINRWRSRHDRAHRVVRPRPADAIFLGDGVSLDYVDGAWEDRFGEPVIAALEERGCRTFLMQRGDLARLPWRRPTYATNVIDRSAALAASFSRDPVHLPGHRAVMDYLHDNAITAPSLDEISLATRARATSIAASAFEKMLHVVRPRVAFVVTYYAGLGPAFLLACRRAKLLSVDIQHCPQEGAHKAYHWSSLPKDGYATVPAVFWSWSERDAADIQERVTTHAPLWHRTVHGGNTQCAPFLGPENATIRDWNRKFSAIAGENYEREILVALQPISGQRPLWDRLADQMESSPASWRWWIRRHPAAHAGQDAEFGRLLTLKRPNVLVEQASRFPLPALLPHMSALVSLASGAAGEAEMFGVPSLFLIPEAADTFGRLIARGAARIIDVQRVSAEIAGSPAGAHRNATMRAPEVGQTLHVLEGLAEHYRAGDGFAPAINGRA
jgi:hypothetical protein